MQCAVRSRRASRGDRQRGPAAGTVRLFVISQIVVQKTLDFLGGAEGPENGAFCLGEGGHLEQLTANLGGIVRMLAGVFTNL